MAIQPISGQFLQSLSQPAHGPQDIIESYMKGRKLNREEAVGQELAQMRQMQMAGEQQSQELAMEQEQRQAAAAQQQGELNKLKIEQQEALGKAQEEFKKTKPPGKGGTAEDWMSYARLAEAAGYTAAAKGAYGSYEALLQGKSSSSDKKNATKIGKLQIERQEYLQSGQWDKAKVHSRAIQKELYSDKEPKPFEAEYMQYMFQDLVDEMGSEYGGDGETPLLGNFLAEEFNQRRAGLVEQNLHLDFSEIAKDVKAVVDTDMKKYLVDEKWDTDESLNQGLLRNAIDNVVLRHKAEKITQVAEGPLPKGLTEEILQSAMQQTGKTRTSLILDFMMQYGN